MQMSLVVNTPNKLEYKFQRTASNYFQFQVRGAQDAHLILTQTLSKGEPIYEILIGGSSNSKSAIIRNQESWSAIEVFTPGILDPNEFRGFWITCCKNIISVMREGDFVPFMSYEADDLLPIVYVHICTARNGKGNWSLSSQEALSPEQEDFYSMKKSTSPIQFKNNRNPGYWIPSSSDGSIPPNATQGGYNEYEKFYIARAVHRGGSLIPGYYHPSHRVCYISYEGQKLANCKYEILCGGLGYWVECNSDCDHDRIPSNAFPAGQSEDGESLFIGRVDYQNTLTIGRVQPSHGCCYIAHNGKELAFTKYEIYVS